MKISKSLGKNQMQNEEEMIKKGKMQLTYEPISIKDIKYRIKWLNDPEVAFGLGTIVRKGTDEEFHKRWFKSYFDDEKNGKRKIFMIHADAKAIGQVGLLDINKEDENAVLYIVIGEKDYWGKGIGKAAIRFIHNHAKQKLNLHKINLYVHARNERALGLYKKMGYKIIGISHDNIKRDEKYEDEVLLEIIL